MKNSKTLNKIKHETFNIEKAIERLKWRFTNENVKVNESKITINELDQKAVEFLINWINNQKKENIIQNELLAKFYTYALKQELTFYEDIQFATNKLNTIASQPIERRYEEICETLNRIEYKLYCKELGIITDHLDKLKLSDAELDKQKELIQKNEVSLKKYAFGKFEKSKIYRSLNNLISEVINKHS